MRTLGYLLKSGPVVGLLLLGATASARANAYPYYSINPGLTSSLEADGLHLSIGFEGNGFGVTWGQTPSGVDVYRRTVGAICGPPVRITSEPVPWSWSDQAVPFRMVINLVDPTTVENMAYEYDLRAVNSQRNPIAEDPDVVAGFATHGVALLGHGKLVGGPDGGYSYVLKVDTCAQECFPFVLATTSGTVSQYINIETTVLLYGEITGLERFYYNEDVAKALFSSAKPGGCVVGVTAATWSAAKQLYR